MQFYEDASRGVLVPEPPGGFFSEESVRNGTTLAAIEQLIDFRRHSKSLANYLYYDGQSKVSPL